MTVADALVDRGRDAIVTGETRGLQEIFIVAFGAVAACSRTHSVGQRPVRLPGDFNALKRWADAQIQVAPRPASN
jgi:hypothetical protein